MIVKWLCWMAAALMAPWGTFAQETQRSIQVPGETEEQTLRWLDQRKERQVRAAGRMQAFHDFGFHDALPKSGITFKHRVVDEAGKVFKPNHYDHGSALAAADVEIGRAHV